MTATDPHANVEASLRLPNLCLFAGLSLLTLLPIGLWIGTASTLSRIVFTIHCLLLLLAVAASIYGSLIRPIAEDRRILLLLPAFIAWIALWQPLAMLPPTARDALIHHLAVPRWWLQAGRIHEIAWHEWSYYPMLVQLGFAELLGFGLDKLCALYHGLYLILLAGLTAQLCYKLSGERFLSALAFVLVLFVPVCFTLAAAPLVDLALAVYCFLAGIYFLFWLEQQKGYLLPMLCGIALGLALGTKFNAILFVLCFAPAAYLACRAAKIRNRKSLSAIAVVLAFAFAVYSPWMLKSAIWTGNPVFPLLRAWFPSPTREALPGPGGLNPLETRIELYGESVAEIIALPIRIFIQGEDNNPRLFDGRLSPFLLLAFLPFAGIWRNPDKRLMLIINVTFVLAALLLSGARVRYLAPIFGYLVLAACLALPHLKRLLGSVIGSAIALAFALLHVGLGLNHALNLYGDQYSSAYIRGAATSEEYLRLRLPEYGMINYVNTNLRQTSRIYLVLTGNQFYYYQPQVYSAGHHSGRELVGWIKKSKSSEELYIRFQGKQLTHMLLHASRAGRLLSSALSDSEKELWRQFGEKHLRLMRSEKGLLLYALVE